MNDAAGNTGEKVIGKAKQLRDIAGAASTVHDWESAKSSGVNVLAQNAVVIDAAFIFAGV